MTEDNDGNYGYINCFETDGKVTILDEKLMNVGFDGVSSPRKRQAARCWEVNVELVLHTYCIFFNEVHFGFIIVTRFIVECHHIFLFF